uniref:Glycosyltransferase family 32 protein n=1 Tax=Macrostomum lignano TaxID=282301 RepID=A0A1I8GBZ1_9PLAT
MVYENYRPMISSCLKLNPNWTYYLWRDSDARALIFLHYPQYMKTYMRFNDNLQRSDAIRYIILHRFGGIYLDMDVECVRPFHPALTRQAAFLDQERVEQTRIAWGRQFSAMNSLMGSVPGHKFFQAMSDRVLLRKLPGDAYSSTGPNVLTQVFQRFRNSPAIWNWPVHLLPPSVASPLMDPNRNWRQLCRYARYGWGSRGCRMLRAKKWRMDDRNGGTVAVHRFLHLGYGFAVRQRKSLFNLTKEFGSARVNFYLRRPLLFTYIYFLTTASGIYLDMDVECLQPFPSSLTRQAAFLDQERLEQTRIFWRRDFSAMNSVMGSAMADRVLTKNTGTSAFSTTGPKVLTEFFKEYKESPTSWIWPVALLPPSVASPLMDESEKLEVALPESQKARQFGFRLGRHRLPHAGVQKLAPWQR